MTKNTNHRKYGLLGKNIGYSFSKKYFTNKFNEEKRFNCKYENYDIKSINEFNKIISNFPRPSGLNVTIPYKKSIIKFLDDLSEEAAEIRAVNTIVFDSSGKIIGHNTDHIGFKKALFEKIHSKPKRALILGSGGASGAIAYVMNEIKCEFHIVSRKPKKNQLSYKSLSKGLINEIDLIVNTTPVGTYPKINESPPFPYDFLNSRHFLFDLIYNPEETQFLKEGKLRNAQTSNGHSMLVYQAEESWSLWNKDLNFKVS